MIGETFGEVPGRGAQPSLSHAPPKIGHRIVISPDGPRGANGAPNCSSHHLDSSHIGFDGSRTMTNGMAVTAQNAPAQFRRERGIRYIL